MTEADMVEGMEIIHRLNNMNFHSPELIWLQPQLGAL